MQFSLVVMLGLVGAALGALLPVDNLNQAQKESTTGVSRNTQDVQNPPGQYPFPTYPEYGPGYAVQTGYEGYLVPSVPQPHSASWTAVLIPAAKFALAYGIKTGFYLMSIVLVLAIGALFTTSICTFTPLCSISFLGHGISQNQVKEQVTELARMYMTPERISAATTFIRNAIDKYSALQQQQNRERQGRAGKKLPDSAENES